MQNPGKRPGMQHVGAPPPSKRLNGGPTQDTPGDSPDPYEDIDFMEEEEGMFLDEEAQLREAEAAEAKLPVLNDRRKLWERPPVEPPLNPARDAIGKCLPMCS
jgi:hypothetical protein